MFVTSNQVLKVFNINTIFVQRTVVELTVDASLDTISIVNKLKVTIAIKYVQYIQSQELADHCFTAIYLCAITLQFRTFFNIRRTLLLYK